MLLGCCFCFNTGSCIYTEEDPARARNVERRLHKNEPRLTQSESSTAKACGDVCERVRFMFGGFEGDG